MPDIDMVESSLEDTLEPNWYVVLVLRIHNKTQEQHCEWYLTPTCAIE